MVGGGPGVQPPTTNLVAEVVQQQLRVQVHARSTPRRELVRLPLRLKSMKPRRLSAAREQ